MTAPAGGRFADPCAALGQGRHGAAWSRRCIEEKPAQRSVDGDRHGAIDVLAAS
jgi:hypothetical protein